jgi:ABC-type multidrug transport system ATPase subunit
MNAIEVNNVSKYFKGAKALEEVSFLLKKGEKLIVLGPNGAGKSTLLRLVSGILKPDKGFIKVLGNNTIENPKEMRMKISFVGENYSLYDNLSVMENLIFFGRLYGLEKENRRDCRI